MSDKTLEEAEGWLAEFGAMADGNGSRCARIMRELLVIAKAQQDATAKLEKERRVSDYWQQQWCRAHVSLLFPTEYPHSENLHGDST